MLLSPVSRPDSLGKKYFDVRPAGWGPSACGWWSYSRGARASRVAMFPRLAVYAVMGASLFMWEPPLGAEAHTDLKLVGLQP